MRSGSRPDTELVAASAPIVFLGMTAVGKTTVGRRVAELTGLTFVDIDHEIERRHGRTCNDIISESGEPAFRVLEQEIGLSLLDRPGHVIAFGGGAWMQTPLREKAQQLGTTIWLHADEALIIERVRAEGRVIAFNPDGTDRVRTMLETRRPVYAQAHVHVLLHGESPDEAAERVIDAIVEFVGKKR